jgi:hypothetical protein
MATKTPGTADARAAQDFEKELMRELRFGGFDTENLSELVAMVAEWQRGGLGRLKVFPRGIPVPDGVYIKGIVDQQGLANLLQRILFETPRLSGIKVFPYGIPFPEIFEVGVDLGAGRVPPLQGISDQL